MTFTFESEGDGVAGIFRTLSEGLTAALRLHRASRDDGWAEGITIQIRIALHAEAVADGENGPAWP